jgi:hypothetical protein
MLDVRGFLRMFTPQDESCGIISLLKAAGFNPRCRY